MPIIKRKKKVKIAEVRGFKDRMNIFLESDGITTGVCIPSPEATPEQIDEAVKRALYVEIGERAPELEGREIEVEYEEEVEK